jgi:membrane associated rhomboid family serine protease
VDQPPRSDPGNGPDRLAQIAAAQGPLSDSDARSMLERARELLNAGEPQQAGAYFARIVGQSNPAITAEAYLGLGDVLVRLDHEDAAFARWRTVTQMPETPATYRAWRQIAGALVRSGDLPGATAAYREADRRAPPEDKAEIASRLGWLAKEQGHTGAASRYFARSRGGAPIGLALTVLAVTTVVSLVAILSPDETLYRLLVLDRLDIRAGELYRLLSVTLLHANFLHLFFNMYGLFLIGPVVEAIWGTRLFGAFYLLTAIAASTASIVFTDGPSVGASGAIFGLVGVLLAGTRVHHPVLDRRARQIVPQLGTIVILNLALGFFGGGAIDNAAHVGGLLSGMWLGLLVPPGKVPTLRSAWQNPGGETSMRSPLVMLAGVVALLAAILLGLGLAGVRL